MDSVEQEVEFRIRSELYEQGVSGNHKVSEIFGLDNGVKLEELSYQISVIGLTFLAETFSQINGDLVSTWERVEEQEFYAGDYFNVVGGNHLDNSPENLAIEFGYRRALIEISKDVLNGELEL
jgi:hypothetical protein